MTIEEAHIKATLEYGSKYNDAVYVSIETVCGDDPTPEYLICVSGEYEGYSTIGHGASWEAAFENAEFEEKRKAENDAKYKAMVEANRLALIESTKKQKQDKREEKGRKGKRR